ncbi:MAG: pyridoxal-phosphate dependent enzyme, partial [Bacteroidetes bacterium]|nr:pyridoxal-phosphate dependent enzyme [Bacteroidota bacterium]
MEGRVSVGEDGYQQYQLKAGGQFESLNYTVSGSRLDYDGYRDNAWIEKTVFNSRLRYAFDEDASLTASLNLLDIPDMGDPGALRADEVETDRRMASPNNLRYAAGESRSQQRLGLVYRNRFGEHHEITLRNYYTFMDFANSLPFTGGIEESNGGQVTFDREFIGGGAQYTYHQTVLDYTFRFIAGIDIDRQEDDRQRYENLEGTRGALTMDQTEKVSSLGAYVQTEFALLEDLQLTLGTRFDEVNFDIIDHFEKVTDQDGALAAREMARTEGLFLGYSCGSTFQGLRQLKDRLKPTDLVVCLFHDH